MRTTSHISLTVAAASHLLAACATTGPTPSTDIGLVDFAETRPAALRITVTGNTAPVLQSDSTGRIVVTWQGEPERIGIDFESGALAVYELPPGQYSIAAIGPLECSGLAFTIDAEAAGVALGSIEANIFRNDPYTALLSGQAASGVEISDVAGELQVAPEAIGSGPVAIAESALCHTSGSSQTQTTPTGDKTAQAVTAGAVFVAIIGTIILVTAAAASLGSLRGSWR